MGDVLGARIGSDDPEKIAEVRKSVPRILAVGAQPTPTPKQAPRLGAVYDERGYLEGRDPRTMSPEELRAMGHTPMSPTEALRARCLDCCAGSAQQVASAWRCAAWLGRSGREKAHGENRLPTNSKRRCANAVAVSQRQTRVCRQTPKTMGRGLLFTRGKPAKVRRNLSLPENSTAQRPVF